MKKKSDKLVVSGSSAIPERSLKIHEGKPYYNRWKWDFNESLICYNDPSRYLGKRIPGLWGIGTEEDYYLDNIKKIILNIAYNFNIKNKNILFIGSSMGGLMSLLLATLVKDSMALADIPQLNLKTYREGNWYNIKKYCFNFASDEYIEENFSYRFNFIEMMKKEKYIPNAILVLDYSFIEDVKSQYSDFFTEKLSDINFKENSAKLKILITGQNKGHVPMSKKECISMVNNIFAEKDIENLWEVMDLKNSFLVHAKNINKYNDHINLLHKYITDPKTVISEEDKGITSDFSSHWKPNKRGTLTRYKHYSELKELESGFRLRWGKRIPLGSIIEFDFLQVDGKITQFPMYWAQDNLYLNGVSLSQLGGRLNKWEHLLLIIKLNGDVLVSNGINSILITSDAFDDSKQYVYFIFATLNDITTIRFKNFKISKI